MSVPDESFVSTGTLPTPEVVRASLAAAHERFRTVDTGATSNVYPALRRADPNQFGLCVADVNGRIHSAGDSDVLFPIMSVAKPFTFALVCETIGHDRARELIGVDPTGLAFNSLEAIERSRGGRTNPMVNPGAIATASLVPGDTDEQRWSALLQTLSRFAGRDLALDDEVYESATATNQRNRAIAQLLTSLDALFADPASTLDLYTRQSCVAVTARDLAIMGATLADGGVNPVTGETVVSAATCRYVLTVMATAGLYETSGNWLYQVGLPAKSGIGGGIVTVSPGKGGMGTFSPPLDDAGNSVRGELAARFLSNRLGLDLFASAASAAATARDSAIDRQHDDGTDHRADDPRRTEP